jgi:hypoxia up-regulated 1
MATEVCLTTMLRNQLAHPYALLILTYNRLALDRWKISGVAEFAKEMEEKKLGKPKVALQFQLTDSGLTTLLKAEATVEETYTVEEEVEVDDEEADAAEGEKKDEAEGDKKEEETTAEDRKLEEDEKNETDTDATDEKKKEDEKPKKKKKTIMQEKVSFVSHSI